MSEKKIISPFSLKDEPSLIEKLLPVQKLSVEAYKEQMSGAGKTLAPLGSYWKGRKPLILNKACILGSLLPATDELTKDLEVFEILMGMDEVSLKKRLKINISMPLPEKSYKEMVSIGKRPEEIITEIDEHIWEKINMHLGTDAHSMFELIEQLGIMRYGHRPKIADTFCGSGQISFEAARLGCDVYAADLNPVACLLTWGALNIVGGGNQELDKFKENQSNIIQKVKKIIDNLDIETNSEGWKAKVFLYCLETKCPQTGWMVPLLPSLVISKPRNGKNLNVVAELIPLPKEKRYHIEIRTGVNDGRVNSSRGTVRSDGRGKDSYMVHVVDGVEYRSKISTLRGDYSLPDGTISNRLRRWELTDFTPRLNDIFQERLYAIQWLKPKANNRHEYEFRAVTHEDLHREEKVIKFLNDNFVEWQRKGFIPDMKIEQGYNTDQPIRERGWSYWHHLLNPRQLLIAGLVNHYNESYSTIPFCQMINWNSRLSRWNVASGGGGSVQDTFYNQALNTLMNYGCRSSKLCFDLLQAKYKKFPLSPQINVTIKNLPAHKTTDTADIFVTDPPYGDAVKYEEILDFFIAWLRKNQPDEFNGWTWDSRKSLAIKGEDDTFRQGMIDAYKNLSDLMPDNGIQIIMFTHQSGSIWADMANIVWASGLQVSAAWYVVTETDSALRGGSHIKGTVVLVLRKRVQQLRSNRDELAWDIQDEVEQQVFQLTGLNQQTKSLYRDENLFADADIQMAGYAAALRVLTKYSIIDGKDMIIEAQRPKERGQKTFVDELIEFAVGAANQILVPEGIKKECWDKLQSGERFYLKLLDLESKGITTLDNYQYFAKAFKVKNYKVFMASERANLARLKSALELGKTEITESSELYNTNLRGLLYAIMELQKDLDGSEVLKHIEFNIPNFFDSSIRESLVNILTFLNNRLSVLRSEESKAANVLSELILNQRLG